MYVTFLGLMNFYILLKFSYIDKIMYCSEFNAKYSPSLFSARYELLMIPISSHSNKFALTI